MAPRRHQRGQRVALKPGTALFTLFLGGVTALPPLSIDMGLPALPAIEAQFPDAVGHGPLTLSLFMLGFAISPLICGPLADRFGRRRTLLAGLVAFIVTAAGSAAAASFTLLLAARLVQGFAAGACVIMPLTIIRDTFEGAAARHLLSQVTALLGLAPMAAPMIGAGVMLVGNWRGIYAVQAGIGVILLVLTASRFAETLPPARRRSLHPAQLLASTRMVLADRTLVACALTYAFAFACMFAFISGSPSVLMGSLGLSGPVFSALFAVTCCGVLLGSLLSGRLSRRHVPSRTILTAGLLAMGAGAFIALGFALAGLVHVYTLMPPVAVVVFCFGLIAPSANHEALRNLAHVAGSAAGIIRCAQMVMGASASALIALCEPLGHPALVMTLIMAIGVTAAGAVYARFRRHELATVDR